MAQTVSLRPGEALSLRLLLGVAPACSVQWVRRELEGLTGAALRGRHAAAVGKEPGPGPELWMREDVLWCRGAMHAFAANDHLTGLSVLHPTPGTDTPRTAHSRCLGH